MSSKSEYEDIRKAIFGLIFLGTPHQGSRVAPVAAFAARWISWLLGSRDVTLQSLRANGNSLADAHKRFIDACAKDIEPKHNLWEYNTSCFYESLETSFYGLSLGFVRFHEFMAR